MNNFVITIARGYGSGGKTIGKMLAKELGVDFYDRELLRMASDESGINERLFAKADEKVKSTLLYKIASKVYQGELIPPDSDDFVSNKNLFNYQAKVIKGLADTQSCIVVGRCADFVLKDYKNTIKIFVHAPMNFCISNVVDLYSLSEKDAEKRILSTDKSRGEYYKYYTGKSWDNAKNYDLCLNSEELGFEKCVELVKAYLDIKMK